MIWGPKLQTIRSNISRDFIAGVDAGQERHQDVRLDAVHLLMINRLRLGSGWTAFSRSRNWRLSSARWPSMAAPRRAAAKLSAKKTARCARFTAVGWRSNRPKVRSTTQRRSSTPNPFTSSGVPRCPPPAQQRAARVALLPAARTAAVRRPCLRGGSVQEFKVRTSFSENSHSGPSYRRENPRAAWLANCPPDR